MLVHLEVARVDELEAERVKDKTDNVDDNDSADGLAELDVKRREDEQPEEDASPDEDDGEHELGEQKRQRERRSVEDLTRVGTGRQHQGLPKRKTRRVVPICYWSAGERRTGRRQKVQTTSQY